MSIDLIHERLVKFLIMNWISEEVCLIVKDIGRVLFKNSLIYDVSRMINVVYF